jgi:hypothetical protein
MDEGSNWTVVLGKKKQEEEAVNVEQNQAENDGNTILSKRQ